MHDAGIKIKINTVNLFLSTSEMQAEGLAVKLHSFFTSSLDGSQWSVSLPGRFIPWKEPRYPLNRRLRGPSTDLDVSEERKIFGL
jgi:hypothetical protein